MTQTIQKEYSLTANDRCDRCGGQAFVLVRGVSGELMFCGHHYKKIINNPVANEKLNSFAYEINDETERLREYERDRISEG